MMLRGQVAPSKCEAHKSPENNAMMLRATRPFLALLVVSLLLSGQSLASQVRLVNLEQMTQRAARIFSGRCIDTRVEHDPAAGRDVTVATFRVERAVKGAIGDTVTVRMLSGGASIGDDPAGAPRFRRGEEVVLFLYGESSMGLSSTVGLGQGTFKVLTDKQGRRVALNEVGNRNLMRAMRPETRARLRERLRAPDGAEAAETVDPASLLDMAEVLLERESRR